MQPRHAAERRSIGIRSDVDRRANEEISRRTPAVALVLADDARRRLVATQRELAIKSRLLDLKQKKRVP